VDFGGGPLTSGGGYDGFVAKLDPAGNHLWSKGVGDARGHVTTDAAGNVLVGGAFEGSVDFGGGPLVSAGGYDVFVAKLDPAGNHLWSKHFGEGGQQACDGVATDASGNVLVIGDFNGPLDFGGGPLANAGFDDVFVAKFDPTGNHLWSKRFGDWSEEEGHGVATDAAGNALVTGVFEGTVDFGGGPLTSAGGHDVFVAKLEGP
jgi:hypothetical protein